MEIWKDADGYLGLYKVSTYGRVWSLPRTKVAPRGQRPMQVAGGLLNIRERGDYLAVGLCKDGVATCFSLHRLIALNFIPNPENKPEVNHKDGNKHNCRVDNLEWATPKENIQHAHRIGLFTPRHGSKGGNAKLNEAQVEDILRRIAQGERQDWLAAEYGVSTGLVSMIKHKKIWPHVTV